MNDFREYSDYIMHYGRKGMHWGKHMAGITEWWKNNVSGSNYKNAMEGAQRERANAIRDVQSGSDRDYYRNRGSYLQGYDNNGKPIYATGSYKDWHDHSATGSTRTDTSISARASVVKENRSIQYNREMYKRSLKGRAEGLIDKIGTTINNIDTKARAKGKSICDSIFKKFGL